MILVHVLGTSRPAARQELSAHTWRSETWEHGQARCSTAGQLLDLINEENGTPSASWRAFPPLGFLAAPVSSY